MFWKQNNELKLLLPIIEPEIKDETIFINFIEPICVSCIISFNVFEKNTKIKLIAMILIYLNVIDKEERNQL